jgi:hypothetical protein
MYIDFEKGAQRMNIIKESIFLKNFIDTDGNVDYKKMETEKGLLELFEQVENMDISNYNVAELKAFWLNAYNISVIKKVLQKLRKNPKWNGTVSFLERFFFFFVDKVKVAGKSLTLNRIESEYIRKQFKDPRIHFAINCGSASCPILPSSLFHPETIDKILDILAKNFINDRSQVEYVPDENVLYLNPIFKWFKKDFDVKEGVRRFLAKYWEGDTQQIFNAKIKYLQYKWTLNSKK